MAKRKKSWFSLFSIYDIGMARIDAEYEYDFDGMKIYDLPLKYPHVFTLIDGEFQDYLYTFMTLSAFSPRLKEIIEKYETSLKIEWIEIKVDDGEIKRTYYIPRFVPVQYQWDVLSRGATKMEDAEEDEFVAPFLCEEKVADRHFIRMFENRLIDYVSGEVKREMVKANITGVEYQKVRTYPDDFVRE